MTAAASHYVEDPRLMRRSAGAFGYGAGTLVGMVMSPKNHIDSEFIEDRGVDVCHKLAAASRIDINRARSVRSLVQEDEDPIYFWVLRSLLEVCPQPYELLRI